MQKQNKNEQWEVIWTSPMKNNSNKNIYKYFTTEEEAKNFCILNKLSDKSSTRVTLYDRLKHEYAVIERRIGNPKGGYSYSYMKLLPDGEATYIPKKGWQKTSQEWSDLGKSLYEIFGSKAVSPLVPKSVLLFCRHREYNRSHKYQAYVYSKEAIEYIRNNDTIHYPDATIFKAEYYPKYYNHKNVIVLSDLDFPHDGYVFKQLKKDEWFDINRSTRLKYYYSRISGVWIFNETLIDLMASFEGKTPCFHIENGIVFKDTFPNFTKEQKPLGKKKTRSN